MDTPMVQQTEDTIDLRSTRTTGEWQRPAVAKVHAEPLDLGNDLPARSVRPSLLTRTLGVFSR